MNAPYDATTQDIFLETEDVCSNFTGEHYHIFLYLKAFVGAENVMKESIRENIDLASSDNFFSGRDFEEILDSAVTTGQKLFYQIVNSAAQTEAGQHWLLL